MSNYKDHNDYDTQDYGIEFLDDEVYEADDDEEIEFNDPEEDEDDIEDELVDDVDYVNIHKELTKKPTLISELLSCLKIFVIAFFITIIFTNFVIMNAKVPTGSMKNTILEEDRLIGNRLAYIFSEPKRGDIVLFKNPLNEEEKYIKRVIGIPGDVVQVINGSVYVNDNLLEEDYLAEPMEHNNENMVFIVPENCYFMMGDNRNHSHDSRYWTDNGVPAPFVSKDLILAKAMFKYYNNNTGKFDFEILK